MLFTFFGQFLVFITPSIQMAQIMASGLNALWQLMNGDSSTLSPYKAVVQLKFCALRLHYCVTYGGAFGRTHLAYLKALRSIVGPQLWGSLQM